MRHPPRPDIDPENGFVLRSVHAAHGAPPAPPWTRWEVVGTVFAWLFMLLMFAQVAQQVLWLVNNR